MAVDFLIITADSGANYLNDLDNTPNIKDVHTSVFEFNTVLGMRVLGPSKIAWVARQHGYTSQVISRLQLLTTEEIINICEPFVNEKTVIGVGTTLLFFPRVDRNEGLVKFRDTLLPQAAVWKMIRVIEHFKNKYNTKTIIGGPKASAFQRIFQGDYVINGEAENVLPKLLDKIKRGGIQKKPYDWDIKTCNYQWHESDQIIDGEPLPLETSRGCIFKCKFCAWSNIGKKPGTFERPLEILHDHLVENYKKYKTTHYWFSDDTFNDDNDRVNAFCDMVESLPFRPYFSGFVRLDLAHRFPHTARRLYKAGMVGWNFGLESFHPQAAKAVGKTFNGKKAKEFLKEFYHNICDEDVMINCCNIIGLPGEPEEFVWESVEWYKQNPYIHTMWGALFLTDPKRADKDADKSIFEVDAHKYGYQFFDHKPSVYWKSPIMDHEYAKHLRERVVHRLKNVNINVAEPWVGMHYLSMLNASPRELTKRGWLDVYTKETSKIQKHYNTYFTRLTNRISSNGG